MPAPSSMPAGTRSLGADVDVPPRPVVEPEVHRGARLDTRTRRTISAARLEGARSKGLAKASASPRLRGDSDLVGIGRDSRAERDEAVVLEDGLALRHRVHRSLTATAGGGSRSQTSCECVCGRLRRSLALVDDRVDVRKALCVRSSGAGTPRVGYERELPLVSSAIDRRCAGACTTTSCRSNAGRGSARRAPASRRLSATAASRAASGHHGRRRTGSRRARPGQEVVELGKGSGAPGPVGGDDYEAAGQRIAAHAASISSSPCPVRCVR